MVTCIEAKGRALRAGPGISRQPLLNPMLLQAGLMIILVQEDAMAPVVGDQEGKLQLVSSPAPNL